MLAHLRRRRGVLAAALTVLAGAVGYALAGPSAPPATAAIGALTWSDEFNAAAGTAAELQPVALRHRRRRLGQQRAAVLHEQHRATRRTTAPATSSSPPGGRTRPAIGCWYGTCQYTSARLLTAATFTQTYGRFEARMRIPRGQGIWPAFWMLGNNIGSVGWPHQRRDRHHGEHRPRAEHRARHDPRPRLLRRRAASAPGTRCPAGRPSPTPSTPSRSTGQPNAITWYVDGVQYSRKTPADLGGDRWVFDHPFFMILNVAVGGNWPGSPDAVTVFPQTLTVDYVRVYAYDSGGGRPAAAPARSPASAASASTSPAPTRPTAPRCSSGTATAPARSAGRSAPTAPSGRSASASTSAAARPPTAPGPAVGLQRHRRAAVDRDRGPRPGEPTGEQVPRRHRRQLRQRHAAADLDLHRRQPTRSGRCRLRPVTAAAVVLLAVAARRWRRHRRPRPRRRA